MLERGKMDRDMVEFVVIDQLVPKEHLLRKVDAAVDFTRLYELVEPLYCEDNGRPSIDPVVLFKMVQRHIWKGYEELTDDARYTPEYRELYKKRKETIERVFADAKEKHAMRYTHHRGLTQVSAWVRLKYAAMNLKKLAQWSWKSSIFALIFVCYHPNYRKPPAFAFESWGFFDRLKPAPFRRWLSLRSSHCGLITCLVP